MNEEAVVAAGWTRRTFLRDVATLAAAAAVGGCEAPLAPRAVAVGGPAPRRIRYGDERDRFGDLYLPAGEGPHPVAAVLHGGFWLDRFALDLMDPVCRTLAARGIAAWNLEYRRLGGGGGWPTTFLDVGAGVDHLKVMAREHRLDLQHVVTLGHSAGGHLALWAAARHRIPRDSPLWTRWPRPVRGVVALAGMGDLRRATSLGLDGVERLLGGTPATVPERYAVASPAELLPFDVPQRLVHGSDDRVVPPALSDAYVRLAREKGDAAALTALPGVGHFEPIDPASSAWTAVDADVRVALR